MDRFVNQDGAAFQIGVVEVDVIFTAGVSGAVPSTFSDFTACDGLDQTTPMALAATGLYTVNLADAYVRLLPGSSFQVVQATYDASHGCRGEINAVSVADTTPTVQFQCVRNDTGAAVAVTAGDVVMIHLRLQRQAQP